MISDYPLFRRERGLEMIFQRVACTIFLLLVVVSARNFACSLPGINQVGIGASAVPLCPNPLTSISFTAPCSWPLGFTTRADLFFGGVFDGTYVWMVPSTATSLARIDRVTGSIALFNAWPSSLILNTKSFFGGVFDGGDIWLVPHGANGVVRVTRTSGSMALLKTWPSGFVPGSLIFVGGVFDGKDVWLIPYDANGVVSIDRTGNMALYNAWPSFLTRPAGSFGGAVFDGIYIWLVPRLANGLVKLNRTNGNMVLFNAWPVGLSGREFFGGVFDGINSIWLVPHQSTNGVVKVDRATGNMTLFNRWPSGTGAGFLSAAFDGRFLWLVPDSATGIVKLDSISGNMTLYNNWPPSVSVGLLPFSAAIFDGQSIWLIPRGASSVVKIESLAIVTFTFTTEHSLTSSVSQRASTSSTVSLRSSNSISNTLPETSSRTTSFFLSQTNTMSVSKSLSSALSETSSRTIYSSSSSATAARTASLFISQTITSSFSQSVRTPTVSSSLSSASRTQMRSSSASTSDETHTESDSCGPLNIKYIFSSMDDASTVAPQVSVGGNVSNVTASPLSTPENRENRSDTVFHVLQMAEVVAAKTISFSIFLTHPLAGLTELNSSILTSFREVLTLFPHCGRLFLPPIGLETAVEILPLKPLPLSRSNQIAVGGSAVAAGAFSAMAGNPVVALQQGTMMALSDMIVCAFSDVEQLDSNTAMLDIALGDDVGQYYRGAIVGFLAVVLGMSVILGSVVELFVGVRHGKREKPTASRKSARWRVAGIVHYPGILVIPFVCYSQGALISAVSLLRLQLSVTDILLACLAIVFISISIGLAFFVTGPWFNCVQGSRVRETPLDFEARIPYLQAILSYVEWDREWCDMSSTNFKKRYKNVFDGFAIAWFPAGDMLSTAIQGVILGIRMNSNAVCIAQSIALFVVSGASLALSLIFRPAGSQFDQHCLVMGKLLVELTCGLVVLTSLGITGLTDLIQWTALAGNFLGMIQTTVLVLLLVLTSARYVKRHGLLSFMKSDRPSQSHALDSHLIGLTDTECIHLDLELGHEEPPQMIEDAAEDPEALLQSVLDAIDDPSGWDPSQELGEDEIAALSEEQRAAFESFRKKRRQLIADIKRSTSDVQQPKRRRKSTLRTSAIVSTEMQVILAELTSAADNAASEKSEPKSAAD